MDIAIILAVILGLLIGSFLNVVIYRVPIMLEREWDIAAREQLKLDDKFLNTLPENAAQTVREHIRLTADQTGKFNLITPPSRCSSCGSPVKPWQNVPIISWLILRGKCHTCKTPISIRYPLVETLTGVLFGLMAWQYGLTVITVGACLFTAFVIALTFIDADKQILPDTLTLPLVWLGIVFNWYTDFITLQQSVMGAIAGYMSLWTMYHLFKLFTGKEGMGYGDFKILAAIGAWLGTEILPMVILASSIVGIIAFVLKRYTRDQAMAFGPCLAVAGWVVFLFHSSAGKAINWWLTKSGF
ncbi:prepilin peptidase [Wielerella bovis]|uniref:prepilin peptidase n=1 Tax=Wielerella bovis TaxID=2917790 RepID=UPI0020192541|nr:A24 family peptidase [Wielerella bovis]MCG7657682.1 A24 family peptidase [Wielerella bovis]MCG7659903.1 A24 family peptidase [Wielerella bovis]